MKQRITLKLKICTAQKPGTDCIKVDWKFCGHKFVSIYNRCHFCMAFEPSDDVFTCQTVFTSVKYLNFTGIIPLLH